MVLMASCSIDLSGMSLTLDWRKGCSKRGVRIAISVLVAGRSVNAAKGELDCRRYGLLGIDGNGVTPLVWRVEGNCEP
jgi:hypothetical protein